ncbi:MAG: glycosyltransferase family 2 protein [Pseudomonadota bacterium]
MAITGQPFFSIGVPTYRRKDLLKQTLSSILAQTFTDFEVIVGNDFVDDSLSLEMLGIDDPRVKIINHKRNMGELENMNYLLTRANGKYFTWQFDDDPCAPTFLNESCAALTKFDFPISVFTSYFGIYGSHVHKFKRYNDGRAMLFSGRAFLRAYLSGGLKAMGCCGFYNTDYLRSIGGVQRLSSGPTALYTEDLLLIKTGLLPEVVYIDAPLVSTRMHEKSWTCSSSDVALFKEAGVNLIRESITVLSKDALKVDFQKNLSSILKSVICAVVVRSIMHNKKLVMDDMLKYRLLVEKGFDFLRGSTLYDNAVSELNIAFNAMPLYIAKARLKMLVPLKYLKYAHIVTSTFSRYMNKAF